MHGLHHAHASINQAFSIRITQAAYWYEKNLFTITGWTLQRMDNVPAELDHHVIALQVTLCTAVQIIERQVCRPLRQRDDLMQRVMALAVRILAVLHDVRRVIQAFEDKTFSCECGQS